MLSSLPFPQMDKILHFLAGALIEKKDHFCQTVPNADILSIHFGEHAVFVLEQSFSENGKVLLKIISILRNFWFLFFQGLLQSSDLLDFFIYGLGSLSHGLGIVEKSWFRGSIFQIFILFENFLLQLHDLLLLGLEVGLGLSCFRGVL